MTELQVGQAVPLSWLGEATTGVVLSRSWSPALGRIVRVSVEHHGQPCPMVLLSGELLEHVAGAADAA